MRNGLFSEVPWYFKAWFAFCALMSVSLIAGTVFVVYKVCKHFGIF